jgi:hypothetical protein
VYHAPAVFKVKRRFSGFSLAFVGNERSLKRTAFRVATILLIQMKGKELFSRIFRAGSNACEMEKHWRLSN